MTIQDLIEKAYLKAEIKMEGVDYVYIDGARKNIHTLVLDPNFWKAVGKVENWEDNDWHGLLRPKSYIIMHEMIDFLYNGGTIENYIKTL